MIKPRIKTFELETKEWLDEDYSPLENGEDIYCLFTGLRDYDKTDVYDGDILQFPDGDFDRGESFYDDRAVIVYCGEHARFILKFFSVHGGEGYEAINVSSTIKRMKVIGNIHSNKDLVSIEI